MVIHLVSPKMVSPLLFFFFFFFFFTLATTIDSHDSSFTTTTTTTTPPPPLQQPQELSNHSSHTALERIASQQNQPRMMPLMLRDVIRNLGEEGFIVTSRLIKEKYTELSSLNNMTLFAVSDAAIRSGSQGYTSRLGFQIVPNHFLRMAELERLPAGTKLPTLERGQYLVVTSAGTGGGTAAVEINHVRIKEPNFIINSNIVVHVVDTPFPTIR